MAPFKTIKVPAPLSSPPPPLKFLNWITLKSNKQFRGHNNNNQWLRERKSGAAHRSFISANPHLRFIADSRLWWFSEVNRVAVFGMGEQRGSNNRWNWEVAGFEPKKSVDDYRKPTVPPLAGRRYSMSISSNSELSKHVVSSKLMRLNDKVKVCFSRVSFSFLTTSCLETDYLACFLVFMGECFRVSFD